MSQADAQPARVIGRYALYAQIAAGGMASVHLGRLLGQAGFSRTVAIKRLHPHLAQDPEFVSMLLDEARLAARIRHPNVVSTLDVVALDGELLVVMEYVHGEALSRLLSKLRKSRAKMPPAVASAIMSGVLYGLHAAHEATSETGEALGIIHRDVSPQNVMVGADGASRVVDFGVAKAAGRLQETREGQLKGKIRYMAPEQLKRGEIDRAADIYAASVVLWECLTSERLFDDDNEWKIAHAIVEGCPDPPSKHSPDVSSELDAVVMKGLSVDRKQRYRTAFDMAAALEDAVPPATARQVAKWVEQTAADSIRQRAAQIAQVEGQSASTSALDAPNSSSSGSWPSQTGDGSDSRKSAADLLKDLAGAGSATATTTAATDLSNLTTAQLDRSPINEAPPPRPIAPSKLEISEPSHTAAGTAASFFPPPPSRKRTSETKRNIILGGLAALVVFAVGLGIHAATSPSAPAAQPTTSATPSPPPSADPVAPVASTEEPAKSAEEPSAEPAASASAAPSASVEKTAKAHKIPGSTHGSGKVAIPAKPVGAQCNPPYFFDKDGVKQFKPECL